MNGIQAAEISGRVDLSGTGYVSLGNSIDLNFSGTNQYTIECWVCLNTLKRNETLFTQIDEFILYVDDAGTISAYRYSTPILILKGTTELEVGVWYYVGVTFDGQKMSLYLDGIIENQMTANDLGTSPQNKGAYLGTVNLDSYLNCLIRGFRAWDICRSQEKINTGSYYTPNAQPNLKASISFNVFPPVDNSGNDIPITLLLGAKMQKTIPGLYLSNQAYAKPSDECAINPGENGSYTIEAWVYLTTLYGEHCIFSNGDLSENSGISLVVQGGKVVSQRGSFGSPLFSKGVLNANEWYYVATTYDKASSTLAININGTTDCFDTYPSIPSAPQGDILIGAISSYGSPTMFMQGYIQFVTIWDKALMAQQIQTLMYEDPTLEDGVIANFGFTVNPAGDMKGGFPVVLQAGAKRQFIIIDNPTGTYLESKKRDLYTPKFSIPQGLDGSSNCVPKAGLTDEMRLFGNEHKKAMSDEFEALLVAIADAGTRDFMRNKFKDTLIEEFMLPDSDTGGFPISSFEKRDGSYHFKHVFDNGELFEYSVDAAEISPCIAWWSHFLITALGGFLSIFFRVYLEDLKNSIMNFLVDSSLTADLEKVLTTGVITFSTITSVVNILYLHGFLKSVLWSCLKMMGWWGISMGMIKIVSMFVPIPTPSKAYAALMTVNTVSKLSLQYVGNPQLGIVGYHESCG